jgi:hypothetical protein
MPILENVGDELRGAVAGDKLASELADAFTGLFHIGYYRRIKQYEAYYTVLYCKPSRTIADSLLIDREVLALVANFDDLQVRAIKVAREVIASSAYRLDPAVVIIVHADRSGDDKLRAWGREHGLRIIPIYRPKAGALPGADALRQSLAQELFASDPFQVTGPVVNDIDFFGRGSDALELLRQLQSGRIRSLFGIRKVGKTSLLNRVITLAREAGSPRVAMIDCSLKDFNRLDAATALRAVAKVAKLAANQGYAHISDALKRTDQELVPVFSDLWSRDTPPSLAIIFDEIDYITPESPTSPHWKAEFNEFWREFRGLVQEAQRHKMSVALLVTGVSSRSFRTESIAGIENSVLHFVPEDYLCPFARAAAEAMIVDLGRRCGLRFDRDSRGYFAEVCGDFPYWIRMAGAHINRSFPIPGRPIEVTLDMLQPLLEEFVASEGGEIARVALENFARAYPEQFALLKRLSVSGELPLAEGRLLARYGWASQSGLTVTLRSSMVKAGLELADAPAPAPLHSAVPTEATVPLKLQDHEWAEELAVIGRRRNLLERKLREFIRVALKLGAAKGETWTDLLLRSLPERRRSDLAALAGDALLAKLYWKELTDIMTKNWSVFERTVGDKNRLQLAMGLINDRPDTHAKNVDMADLALYRRELDWLEDRIA